MSKKWKIVEIDKKFDRQLDISHILRRAYTQSMYMYSKYILYLSIKIKIIFFDALSVVCILVYYFTHQPAKKYMLFGSFLLFS